MKQLIFNIYQYTFKVTLLLLVAQSVYAGGEGHGSNHIKTRFLWAREIAMGILGTESCNRRFSADDCLTMKKKLSRSVFVWKANPNDPLTVTLHGVEQEVSARTTKELQSVIEIDLLKTKDIGILEAVVVMIHEAGHAVHLSDDLITDQIIIDALQEEEDLKRYMLLLDGTKAQTMSETGGDYRLWNASSLEILRSARLEAQKSNALAEERKILQQAMNTVLNTTPPEYQKYILLTLEGSVSDTNIFDDEKSQVALLRKYAEFTHGDLSALSRLQNTEQTYISHIKDVLSRTIKLSLNSAVSRNDNLVFIRQVERAALSLNQNIQSKVFICAQQTLHSALHQVSALEQDSVKLGRILRSHIMMVLNDLDRGTCSTPQP